MIYILLVSMSLAYSFQTLFCKLYSMHYRGHPSVSPIVFAVIYGFSISFLTLAVSGFSFAPSPMTVIFGVCNGVILFLYNIALINATIRGPYSFVTICAMFGGIVLPILSMALLWQERLPIFKIIAIALILFSFLLINSNDLKLKGSRISYYLWCGLLLLVNGAYGTLMSSQQLIMAGTQRREMIIITFASACIVAIFYLLLVRRGHLVSDFKFCRKALISTLASCIFATYAVNVLLYMLSNFSISILSPINSGLVMLLVIIYSVFIFKERFTVLKLCGISLALFGILALTL